MNSSTKRPDRPLRTLAILMLMLMVLTWSSFSHAQRDRKRLNPPPWHGDISKFHAHDWNVWRSGHWNHGLHHGRMGWWWVIGSSWYFYPSPVYPYPSPWEPPATALVYPPESELHSPPPPTLYWYYCDATSSYYPYVSSYAGGWRQVPATPGDATKPAN